MATFSPTLCDCCQCLVCFVKKSSEPADCPLHHPIVGHLLNSSERCGMCRKIYLEVSTPSPLLLPDQTFNASSTLRISVDARYSPRIESGETLIVFHVWTTYTSGKSSGSNFTIITCLLTCKFRPALVLSPDYELSS
jgi:hypothetical protein